MISRSIKGAFLLLSLTTLRHFLVFFDFSPSTGSVVKKDGDVHVSKRQKNGSYSWKLIQDQARKTLESMMQHQQVFNTTLTTEASVLKNGFPRQLKPCTLQGILESEKAISKRLQIVVLGGSASARPCSGCSTEDDLYVGRYSNVLQTNLQNALNASRDMNIQVQVSNMAQGGVNSEWSALLLDRLVDPFQADLLVWEFALNDYSAMPDIAAKRLNFWLSRVEALFYTVAKRPPPPIILLYLWETYVGRKPAYVERKGLVAKAYNEHTKKMIDHYRNDLGWNIQVINVGSSINGNVFLRNKKALLDDVHHPNQVGVHLIADMLQYTILQDISTCISNIAGPGFSTISTKQVQESNEMIADHEEAMQKLSIEKLLFRKDVRMGSFTNYLPQRNTGMPVLRFGNSTQMDKLFLKLRNADKNLRTRQDRKKSYNVPDCLETTSAKNSPGLLSSLSWLNITLLEPNLEWLGLMYIGTTVHLLINDKPVPAPNNGKDNNDVLESVRSWIHVAESVPYTTKYKFSLCRAASKKDGRKSTHPTFLEHILAITL
jgi:hypothetical protein